MNESPETIQQIAKEMRGAAGDFESWGRDVIEGFADRLEALQADAREKGEDSMPLPHGFSCGGVNVWARDAASISKVRHWMDQAHAMQGVADELREEVKRLRLSTQPAQASEADKVLRKVWSILGPLPALICNGCADELTLALEAMRDYLGSNDYPATSSQETASE